VKVALGLVLGLVVGGVTLRLLLPTLAAPVLQRTNHRGAPIATAAGLVVVLAVLGADVAVTVGVALVVGAALALASTFS
jgi:hypothetical protein